MIKFLKNKIREIVFLFIVIFFILETFKLPYNIYSIQKRSYQERMERAHGYCDKEGYGFVNFIFKKFNVKRDFPSYFNLSITPGIYGVFGDYNYPLNTDEIIIIGFEENLDKNIYDLKLEENNKKINLSEYLLVSRKGNCYYFKKND